MNNDGYLDIGISYYGEDGVQVWKCLHPEPVHVNVNSPNGGERIRVGSEYDIKWRAFGGLGILKIKLEYSTTGPTGTYSLIADMIDNTGEYTWDVPLIESNNCYLRLSANDSSPFNNIGFDLSNNSFELYKLPLTKVRISPESPIIVTKEDKINLRADAFDSEDKKIEKGVTFEWSLQGDIGDISFVAGSNVSVFTAKKIGSGEVSATAIYFGTEVSAKAVVIVPQELADLKFNPSQLIMITTNTYDVSVQAIDKYDLLIDDEQLQYSWKLYGSVAKFQTQVNDEVVTLNAISKGQGELEVTVNYYNMSLTKKLAFEVVPKIYVFGVTPVLPVVKLGENVTLRANALGLSDANLSSFASIAWKIEEGEGQLIYSSPGTTARFIPETTGWVKVNATINYYDDKLVNITWIFVPMPLDRIKVTPDVAFVYFDDTALFEITAYDMSGNKISDKLKLSVEIPNVFGNVEIASDGLSFWFSPFAMGKDILTVTAEYYGYFASNTVEITVPPPVDSVIIEVPDEFILVKQSVTFKAVALDSSDNPITGNLEYSWYLPRIFSDREDFGETIEAIPLETGRFNISVNVTYYGRTFTANLEIEILPTIDMVRIEISKNMISKNEQIELTARVFDPDGNEITDNLKFKWKISGGSLDNFNSQTVNFKSSKPGVYKIEVTVQLGDMENLARSDSVTVQVKDSETSASWLGSTTNAALLISLICVIIIFVIIFFMMRRKKARKQAEVDKTQEEIQLSQQGAVIPAYIPSKQLFTSDGSEKYVNYGLPYQSIPRARPQPVKVQQPQPSIHPGGPVPTHPPKIPAHHGASQLPPAQAQLIEMQQKFDDNRTTSELQSQLSPGGPATLKKKKEEGAEKTAEMEPGHNL
ncbi:MAG: hypothetical protein JSV49_05575 [Thermoplasmata archaeon]|nr:MAG: hypothetical protein JSV49_05575 [Thermoplasmata archaeon]